MYNNYPLIKIFPMERLKNRHEFIEFFYSLIYLELSNNLKSKQITRLIFSGLPFHFSVLNNIGNSNEFIEDFIGSQLNEIYNKLFNFNLNKRDIIKKLQYTKVIYITIYVKNNSVFISFNKKNYWSIINIKK